MTRWTSGLFLALGSILVCGQSANVNAPNEKAEALRPGVVVEEVAKYSEADKAGLQEGDIVLTWGRGDAKGEINSPFTLYQVEIEQAPIGTVSLKGLRKDSPRTWTVGPDSWRTKVRPNFDEGFLALHNEARHLVETKKLVEAAERWRDAGNKAEKLQPENNWLAAWLFFRTADALALAGKWPEAEVAYNQGREESRLTFPASAYLPFLWAENLGTRGDWAHARTYYQAALEECKKAGQSESVLLAKILSRAGFAAIRTRDLPAAEKLYQESLAMGERLAPESLLVANAFYGLGLVAHNRADLEGAEKQYLPALRLWEKLAPQSLGFAAALNNLGVIERARGKLDQAEESLRRALVIREKFAPGSVDAASSLVNLGSIAHMRGDLKTAEETYLRALAIEEKLAPDSLDVAGTLNNLSVAAQTRGDLDKAKEYQERALAIREKLAPGSLDVAMSLNNLGSIANARGDLEAQQQYFEQALAIREKLAPGTLEVADGLNNLGAVARTRGDLDKAEEYQKRALEIREKLVPGSLDVAMSLNNLGLIAYDRGILDKAEEYHEHALAIRERTTPDSPEVATSLINLGSVAHDRGDLDKDREYQTRALEIWQKRAPGNLQVAYCLNNLGRNAEERGDLIKAAEYHRQSLAIREKLAPNSIELTHSLQNLGIVAQDRGDLAKAEEYQRRALSIQEKHAPDSPEVGNILGSLGLIAYQRGELPTAANYFGRALQHWEKLAPGSLDVSHTLDDLGSIAHDQGNLEKAEDYYARAFAIQEKQAPLSMLAADSLSHLGRLALDRNELDKAEDYQRRALAIIEKLTPGSEAHAERLATLAGTMVRKGQPSAAEHLYAQALDALENQASHLGGSETARTGFRARHLGIYNEYAGLLIHQQKPDLALQVVERSRARGLLETLASAQVDIHTGVDPALVAQEHSLLQAINAKSQRHVRLLGEKHTEEQLAALEQEISSLSTSYQELKSTIQAASPVYAALTQPSPLTVTQIQQQLLDPETILLEYSLGEERSFVWVVSNSSLAAYELPKRSEIERLARRVYDLLNARNMALSTKKQTEQQIRARWAKADAEYPKVAARLSQMVLGPVSTSLAGKRLLIVSEGALQYIPFSALPAPEIAPAAMTANAPKSHVRANHAWTPLAIGNEIVNLPSASVLAELRRQQMGRRHAPQAVAVLADPVFDRADARVQDLSRRAAGNASSQNQTSAELLTRSARDLGFSKNGRFYLPRLLFSRREAEAIMAVTPAEARLKAVDFQATRAMAMNPSLSQYRIVHFATHGLLDSTHPELSGIVLSLVDKQGETQDGFLGLQDIYNLNLPADLVVLSACETGLGEEISGEGLVGLTRGFMYAGASRVVASLWSVNDQATSELMGRFYRALQVDKMRPTAALRSAQIQMWKQIRWKSPFYWAGFQIQGEWK